MSIQKRPDRILQRLVYGFVILLVIAFNGAPRVFADETVPSGDTSTTSQQPSTPPAETATPPPTESTSTEQTTPSSTPVSTTISPPSDTTTQSPPAATTPGPQQPTGADSNKYTYNQATGLWESDKYTWDPVTHQTSPKTTPTYSYNPATGMWDTTQWIYDAPSGKYVPNIISAIVPPSGATIVSDAPEQTTPQSGAPNQAGPTSQKTTSLATPQQLAGDNQINGTSHSKGVFDMFYNAVISNNLTSSAITGDALTSMNTLAGNAVSGDATAISTILNLLQSVWNLGITGNLFTTFTQNLFGNVLGDLWLSPGQAPAQATSTTTNDLTVNASNDAAIHNTINLASTSGDAAVTSNTTGGNATTGNASVVANIINAINSSIVSGHSFVGMLNIFGNLDGDILLPQNLINTLLASNTLGTLDTSKITNTNVLATFNNNASTVNNVNATATSGAAAVTDNTKGGSASTGDASTNVTLLNLTGREVVGKDALLVFVNVLGKWVGMIVNAPTGTTSAALGGGIVSDTTNNNLTIDATNDQNITNDINTAATTGNALVSHNTSGGNATSGDAKTAVNILNMNGSQFALSDWFGVLFINVFGTWNGSFGIDTAAGTLPKLAVASSSSSPSATLPTTTAPLTADSIRAFKFVPHADGSYTLEHSADGVAALTSAHVLSTNTTHSTPKAQDATPAATAHAAQPRDWTLTLLTTTLGLSLLGAERIVTRRGSRR